MSSTFLSEVKCPMAFSVHDVVVAFCDALEERSWPVRLMDAQEGGLGQMSFYLS